MVGGLDRCPSFGIGIESVWGYMTRWGDLQRLGVIPAIGVPCWEEVLTPSGPQGKGPLPQRYP